MALLHPINQLIGRNVHKIFQACQTDPVILVSTTTARITKRNIRTISLVCDMNKAEENQGEAQKRSLHLRHFLHSFLYQICGPVSDDNVKSKAYSVNEKRTKLFKSIGSVTEIRDIRSLRKYL